MDKGDQEPAVTSEAPPGVQEVVLPHWRAFVEQVIQKEMLRPGLIWRGQRRGWALRPRLDREFTPPVMYPADDPLRRQDAEEKKQWDLRYANQFHRFRTATAGRRGINPRNLDGEEGEENENDEWWALGQHYGLHTPFLDWSDSPFAALFFAFIEDSVADRMNEEMGEHFRWVFALDSHAIDFWNIARGSSLKEGLRSSAVRAPDHDPNNPVSVEWAAAERKRRIRERLRFPQIRVVRPTTDENLRLLSQGGVFTQAPPGKDLEGFIRETFQREHESELSWGGTPEAKPAWMLKFKIVEDDQADCLAALNRMAINYRTLFPDLQGAGLFVNRFISHPEY